MNLVYHLWIAIVTLALCFIIHCPRPLWLVCQASKPESHMYGATVWFPKAFGKFSWWQGQSEGHLGEIWMWHCQEHLQMLFIAKSSLTIGPQNVRSEFSCKISFYMNPVIYSQIQPYDWPPKCPIWIFLQNLIPYESSSHWKSYMIHFWQP